MDGAKTVLIVEDEQHARDRLAGLVDNTDGFVLVGAVDSVASARTFLEAQTPEIVLCDLGLPDGDGTIVIDQVSRAGALALVISVFGDETNVIRAIEHGACGYLLKDSTLETIESALHDLVAGGSPITPSIARHVLSRLQNDRPDENKTVEEDQDAPTLTDRETEVLDLISRGFKFSEIAGLLAISHHTVGNHVRKVYRKLNVSSRSEAVFEAVQWGIISIK